MTASPIRATKPNAVWQQLVALTTNRQQRRKQGRFLVQGVVPIDAALEAGWPIDSVVVDADRRLSKWAMGVVALVRGSGAVVIEAHPDLIAALDGRDREGQSGAELVLAARLPAPDWSLAEGAAPEVIVVLDRPSLPGNIGAIVRTADAFGAGAVVVSGHAADPYDPAAVRASRGALFRVPVGHLGGVEEVRASIGDAARIVVADEAADTELGAADLSGRVALVFGSEAPGLSAAWKEAADTAIRIPMRGGATSLNVAAAVAVTLYETDRQRAKERTRDEP